MKHQSKRVCVVEKEIIEDSSAYVDELNEGSEYKVTSARKKLVERHHAWKEEEYKGMPSHVDKAKVDDYGNEIRPRYLSNPTHYSPTDPDLYTMPNQTNMSA